MIESNTPGFSRGKPIKKIGLHAQDTAELFFTDCEVPGENLLGKEGMGFKYLMQKLQQDVTAITQEIGKKEGYLLIMDKRGVIYTPNSVDLTDKLIQKLNAKSAKAK